MIGEHPLTFNRPQAIAFYALAMKHGPGTEFTLMLANPDGSLLVEVISAEGKYHYMLPKEGGSHKHKTDAPREEE